MALWLEAHIPGQPLNFLDHHIKCGNAIIGFTHLGDLAKGVPMEAFKTLPNDDKDVADSFRKRNSQERKRQGQLYLDFSSNLSGNLEAVVNEWGEFSALPESTISEIETKKKRYSDLTEGQYSSYLRVMASIPIAQFFTPKNPSSKTKLVTDNQFHAYWRGQLEPDRDVADNARVLGKRKRIFHWFIEFPEIMNRGGFDCILGNPPYLGGQSLRGTYGDAFCNFIKWQYAPAGLSDLVVYFLRRIYGLLQDDGFAAIITTNSIVDGKIRRGWIGTDRLRWRRNQHGRPRDEMAGCC